MYWPTAYSTAVVLLISLLFLIFAFVAMRIRMRPSLVAGIGMVLVIGVVAFVAYGPREKPTPASPHFQERSGESAAGKNDSTTGKSEQARAREIMQTAGPLTLSDEQRRELRNLLAARGERPLDSSEIAITVGASVPRQIELYDLPAEMSDVLHGYNGDKYFLVRDQMIIVDSEARRIVAVIPGMK
jgi:hypothetical protein